MVIDPQEAIKPEHPSVYRYIIKTLGTILGLLLITITAWLHFKSLSCNITIVPELDISKCPPINESNTKRIWTYWHSDAKTLPLFLIENIKLWRHVAPDWEIRLITGQDEADECHYSHFISNRSLLPTHFDKLFIQGKSDSVRLALMRLYGGVYLDCSIILLEPLELRHWNYVTEQGKRLVAYTAATNTLRGTNDGIEIWMLVAKAQEPLIIAWHDLYLKVVENQNVEYPGVYNESTNEINPLLKGTVYPSGWTTYRSPLSYGLSTTVVHTLIQFNKTFNQMYNNESIISDASTVGIFYLGERFSWDRDKELAKFLTGPSSYKDIQDLTSKPPIIKLFSHASYFKDEEYDAWHNLRSPLGAISLTLAKKSQRWRNDKVWETENFTLPQSKCSFY